MPKEQVPKEARWKKGARAKRVYKTVEELRAESESKATAPVALPTKIIDMTGPQVIIIFLFIGITCFC